MGPFLRHSSIHATKMGSWLTQTRNSLTSPFFDSYGLNKPSMQSALSETTSLLLRFVALSDLDGSPEACVDSENFVLDARPVLSGRWFKSLKKVNLVYYGRATDSEPRRVIGGVFVGLRGKGIFRMLGRLQYGTVRELTDYDLHTYQLTRYRSSGVVLLSLTCSRCYSNFVICILIPVMLV